MQMQLTFLCFFVFSSSIAGNEHISGLLGKAVSGNGNEGYVAILAPQTLTELPIMVTTSKGQSLVFEPEKPLSFASGHAYATSTLTVPKQGAQGPKLSFTVSITDWADGGSMDFQRGKYN